MKRFITSIVFLVALETIVYAEEEYYYGYEQDDWPAPLGESELPARRRLAVMQDALPPKWDARDHGWVTPVKNQGQYGTCWTFSSLGALESAILKSEGKALDLSEKNMACLRGCDGSRISGGNDRKAAAYLLRWAGAVLEMDDPYPLSGNTEESFGTSVSRQPVIHVQNMIKIAGRKSIDDNDTLKRALLKYGALSAHYMMDQSSKWWNKKTGAFYCNAYKGTTNHAVLLVGWDDAYSKDNFPTPPDGDGAWIVKNSWGTGSGDNGYIYVSYYDTTFAFNASTAFIPASANEDYTAQYSYDALGQISAYGNKSGAGVFRYGAAIFTAFGGLQELKAVGFYSMTENTSYRIWIYTGCSTNSPTDGRCVVEQQEGVNSFAGFTTIHLDTPVVLDPGTRFSIVIGLSSPTYGYPIAFEKVDSGYSKATARPGQTFYGGKSNTNWTDAFSLGENRSFCCRAYVKAIGGYEETANPQIGCDLSPYSNWLTENYGALLEQGAGEPAASALIRGVNGLSLWHNFFVGTDPMNPNDTFNVSISMIDGGPQITWTPNLNSNGIQRLYTIYGKANLTDERWMTPTNTTHRFFKVTVDMP